MGYILHHTIVVTHWEKEKIESLHKKALELFEGKLVSNIVDSAINSNYSFFIAPDGSKEGWDASDMYNKKRDQLKELLTSKEYHYCRWVELHFGGDNDECDILDSNCNYEIDEWF
jgi:hypothetical protein